ARYSSSVHIGMQDMPGADVDAEAAADVDPSLIPDADKGAVYNTAMQLASIAKHNDKAAKYAKAYLAVTPTPPAKDVGMIAVILYQGGAFADAAALAQKDIDAATAAGQKPSHSDLIVIKNVQAQQKDEAGAEKTLETLVANYNMPEDWSEIMSVS